MKLKTWRESGNYYNYKGFSIFYRLSQMSDEVVLCLHGFPTSSFDYHKIHHALAERFAVLSFDMIGYGFSAKPANYDYTTFNQVDVLQSLLDYLKIRRVHILAHDYGNTITQELLARAEENRLDFSIETICLLNGALFPETHRPILAQKILISPIGFVFGRLITDSKFKKSLASIFGEQTQPSEDELNDFTAVFKFNDGRRIAHRLIRYMRERAVYRERWVGALQRTKVPFRFINGSADKVSGKHLVERFRSVVPHQTNIIELEGVGHFPHFETPERVLDEYLKFNTVKS
ncbi:MAG: Alpha/beta hydrolase fold [uncultured Pyrinomonadaceae bacterium]|uniref:Alpha/beta hydrolase fold n=1 Tax=uncultured Pyrinomonadaceae bacterium TaxID=2283094 RepID=A0A6J4PVV4_9BACT|nr:MAG: Alpha/beta hydrolase fold [uncultured Pyrinomonadaceae bacterium]